MVPLAHVAGIPVEELLPWVIPIGGFGLAGAAAWGRDHLRISRRRIPPGSDRKEPC
jgi:hypothetical protein